MISVSGGLDAWQTLLSKSHGCSLISWMTGQFLPLAMYKTGNFWKKNFTGQSVLSHIYVLLIYFFVVVVVPAHYHITASYEALRLNRTLHTRCKHNSISTLSCFQFGIDNVYGFILLYFEWPHMHVVVMAVLEVFRSLQNYKYFHNNVKNTLLQVLW